ncbi:hypothetical protein [Paludibaculum fermentans]|uniref:hypothetical protein n=1 Tax=Paludibaculum fermentans TaxID=1473598 RepID=UPI003EC0233D
MPVKFVPLSCENCGGKLEVYEDMTRFACAHCGSEMIAEHRGSTVILKSVRDAIQKVQAGTEKTAAELSIVRLRQEIAEKDEEIQQAQAEAETISRGFLLSLAVIAILGLWITVDGTWLGVFLWIPAAAIGLIYYSGNKSLRMKARRHTEQARVERDSLQLRLASAQQIADS